MTFFPARDPATRRTLRTRRAGGAILLALLAGLAMPLGGQDRAVRPTVDRDARTMSFPATVQARAFLASTPPDHQYHAIVTDDGGAVSKSLFSTPVADSTVARLLRGMGAEDAGGLPMSAWNLRWVPLVPQPGLRVEGTRVKTMVHWDGAPRSYELEELLEDPGRRGVEVRFGGHEHHSDEWDSGCILCLFSCPGGVMSNAAYSIRDHQRGVTAFTPGDLLPPDGTRVTVTLTLVPD